jgi:hypothetical protein
MKLKKLFVAALFSSAAAVCANAQNLNGTLNTSFYGSPLFVQTINTGFGDANGGDDTSGSELDAVYTKVSGGNLYLFIAGALQNNGNVLDVFVAGGATGENTLSVPTGHNLGNMNGSVFPPGFQATWAFDMHDSGGTLFSEEYTLTGTPAGGYVGALAESSTGMAAGSDGGVASLYFNNTLVSTMGASGTALSGASSGANTTTGLEMVIPLSAIGYTSGTVNVLLCINGGGNGYLSNQFLPGLAVGSGNLGSSTFNFGAEATPTNYVTFTLDLSEEVELGNFINLASTNSVAVGGNYLDSFGTGDQLTNYTLLNPGDLNPGLKTNWYVGTFPVVAFLPAQLQFKFRVNNLDGGYEQPVSTSGGNRVAELTQQNTVFPVISYDDLGLGDLLVSNVSVMFSILVTNGTPDDTGYAFQKGSDEVFVNGAWLNWPAWGANALPPNQQMIEVGTSDVYTNYFLIPRGDSIYMTYKYSFNGLDDENGFGTNHIREIRSYGPTYSFPQDVWSWNVLQPANGNPYTLAGIASTNITEPDFGYLKIGQPSGGNVPITWLGRPAVILQNASSLTSGAWNSLSGTDGTQATNWPSAGAPQFFRLMKQ